MCSKYLLKRDNKFQVVPRQKPPMTKLALTALVFQIEILITSARVISIISLKKYLYHVVGGIF